MISGVVGVKHFVLKDGFDQTAKPKDHRFDPVIVKSSKLFQGLISQSARLQVDDHVKADLQRLIEWYEK